MDLGWPEQRVRPGRRSARPGLLPRAPRVLRALWSGGVVAVLCLVAGPPPAAAHSGEPIAVRATTRRDPQEGLFLEAQGHAHFPDGARLGVGLKRLGAGEYVIWYDAYVRGGRFRATLGPWLRRFAPGYYALDARYDAERQTPAVLTEVRKAAGKRRPAESVTARAVIYLGSRFQEDQETRAAAKFYGDCLVNVQAAADAMDAEFARHAQRAAGATPETWRVAAARWEADEARALLDLRGWGERRIGDPYADLAKCLATALTRGVDLRRALTRKLYPDQVGDDLTFPGATDVTAEIETARRESRKALAACAALLPAAPQ